jgi:response regulator RpfG family c-di-GMP phosphodiesterase
MNKKLSCIMLVDDNSDDNFFHEREIKKFDSKNIVITKNSATAALEYLRSKTDPHSDLIFLDINMPGMNGWEFLQEYNLLDKELQGQAIIIMLTTSENSDDIAKAKTWNFISDYITKPLTKEIVENVCNKYFSKTSVEKTQ